MTTKVNTVLVLLSLFTGIALVTEGFQERSSNPSSIKSTTKAAFIEVSPKIIPLITLGHKNIYDHFLSLWLLQALLDDAKTTKVISMMSTIRSVIKHRPKSESLYTLSCIVMFQDYSSPEYCQEISLAGIEAFPNSWKIPMLQGYIHTFLTREPAQAASFFAIAASRSKSPKWVKRLAHKLLKRENISLRDIHQSLNILGDFQNPDIIQFMDQINKIK